MIDAVCNAWDVATFRFPVSQYSLSWAVCLTPILTLAAATVLTLAGNVRVRKCTPVPSNTATPAACANCS